MTKLLLAIKRFFLFFGIEVRFVKKSKSISAVHLNDVNTVNKAWSDSKVEKLFYSKEVQKLYDDIITIIKKNVTFTFKHVLDVGCGTGKLLNFFASHFKDITLTGMEYASAALDIAKKNNPEARYILHDICNSFDEKFDIVLSTEVLEHIIHPEVAYKNLLEMTNIGGALFVSVPNGRIDTFEGHINFWSPESWRVFVENNSIGLRFETGILGARNLYALIFK